MAICYRRRFAADLSGVAVSAGRCAPFAVGLVAAIRESSVLIALVLASLMLKERLDQWRIAAGLLIVSGAAAIILGAG